METPKKKKATSPGAAIKNVIIVTYILTLGVVMLYGAFAWRYAPIRLVNGQYVDKRGEVHSAEDYRRFRLWERLALTMFGVGLAVGFAAPVVGKLLKSGGAGRK